MPSFCTLHSALCTFFADWQVTAGDWSESLGPALFALAALASAWVFHDARRREGFGPRAVWAWALLTLLFPPAVLPLYLAARLYTRRAGAGEPGDEEGRAESEPGAGEGVAAEGADAPSADAVRQDDEGAGGADGGQADGSEPGGGETGAGEEAEPATATAAGRGFAPTLLYTAALALAGGLYFYADYRSFEAHLARAERAKLRRRPDVTVGEYRAALRVREDGHTRKLLALELLQQGRHEEALAELLAAARAGEPQEGLDLHIASALSALGRRAEASAAYRRFLSGPSCAKTLGDEACEAARARLAPAGPR